MTRKRGGKSSGDAALAATLPLPARPGRSPRLDTTARIRRELTQVYRAARHGVLPWAVACQACHLLANLHRMLEASAAEDLAARLDKAERELAAVLAAQGTARWAA